MGVKSAVVVKDVGSLVKLLDSRNKALLSLEQAWTKWLGNPVWPDFIKGYSQKMNLNTSFLMVVYKLVVKLAFSKKTHSLRKQHTVSERQDLSSNNSGLQQWDLGLEDDNILSQVITDRKRPPYQPSWFSLKQVDLIDHCTTEF
ncbi:hypothetical protein PPACK8108_LOCUS8616 [Phakopsora pachyrhizi]|uniref:Uncharacterized protein n=1 Tax=Phakopsora pachyrhizi TaxID=170000 RepID=A0AAV0AYG8_PHAPC|nr:hypothetical protein PPACK8108_LOCUS8616 [Phakopsora pachyrhizi]